MRMCRSGALSLRCGASAIDATPPEPVSERQICLKIPASPVVASYARSGTSPGTGGPFGAALVPVGGSSYGRRMVDDFSERYGDLLTGSYDCVDRIVLNAYYPMGHGPGGFR